MDDVGSKKSNRVHRSQGVKLVRDEQDPGIVRGVTRRNFLLYTVGAVAGGLFLGTMNTGCGSNTHMRPPPIPAFRWLFSRMSISILFMTKLFSPRFSPRTPASGRVFFRRRA